MTASNRKLFVSTLFATLLLSRASSAAAEPVTVSVNVSKPGAEISPLALGVSYETSQMLPNDQGVRYFRPDNQPLVNVFKTVGIKNLRMGGNSVDAKVIPIPSEDDVASLFDFAKAANVKVMYSIRLEDGDPAYAAKIAKLIHDRYADVMDTFAIGNEPYYYKDYAVYTEKWTAIRDAILAVYPEATFCGPDQNPNPEMMAKVAQDFGNAAGHLTQITVHQYPFGCAYKFYKQEDITKLDSNKITELPDGRVLSPFDPAESRDKMLSPKAYAEYEKVRADMAALIGEKSLTFRLTEANSFWFSGLQGASDSCASALWSADYLNWWMHHGAAGVNFHTGDRTGGTVTMPCRYAAFVTSANGYEVRPLAYGMKLFALGSQGKTLPATVSSPAESGLAAYATLAEKTVSQGKTVFVTLINKAHGAGAETAKVRIKLDVPLSGAPAETIFLRLKNDDVAGSSSDVTLGGAAIEADGTWKGAWAPLAASADAEQAIDVTMPPASAAVVRMTIR